jgi:hypothetical protein
MAIIRSMVKVGQKPPRDVMMRVREAAKHPIVYTADCPESTPEALREFAFLAAARDRATRERKAEKGLAMVAAL